MIDSGTVSRCLPFGRQIDDARKITANYSDGTGACIIKRIRESATVGKSSAGGDRQDDMCPG